MSYIHVHTLICFHPYIHKRIQNLHIYACNYVYMFTSMCFTYCKVANCSGLYYNLTVDFLHDTATAEQLSVDCYNNYY